MVSDYFKDNKTFLVYKDWEKIINCLDSDEEVGILFRAIFAYASRGETTEFHGALKVAYTVMVNQIQRDGIKWERKCLARSEAGRKGGRPRKIVDGDPAINAQLDKIVFGEFEHVFLAQSEYDKLVEQFGEKITAEYIRKVDEYAQQHDRIYSDYYLTIRNWIREDYGENFGKEKSNTQSALSDEASTSQMEAYYTPEQLEKFKQLFPNSKTFS